ncbi:MAG: hypothetical protein ACQEV7_03120 [Bacillota bacterium]
MKSFFKLISTAMLVFTLGACNNEAVSKSNTVSVDKLSEKENAILSTTSDKSFVFDFNIDNENKEVRVWIEKYESGVLVEDKISDLTAKVEKTGFIIFTTSKKEVSQKYHIFNIGISSNDTFSSLSTFDTDSDELEKMSSTWSSFPDEITEVNGEVVLASICYSSTGDLPSFTEDFYKDVEAHMNELEEYDVVYLLKTEFIN